MTQAHARIARRFSIRGLLLGTTLLLALPGTLALASPKRQVQEPNQHEMNALDLYLERGPHYWVSHVAPTIPAGISILQKDGALKDDMFVKYLEWRQERDPKVFDHRHPHVAAAFAAAVKAEAQQISGGPSPVAESLALPPTSPTTASAAVFSVAAPDLTGSAIHPEAQVLGGAVPEPSSWLVALFLGASAVWWLRRGSRLV